MALDPAHRNRVVRSAGPPVGRRGVRLGPGLGLSGRGRHLPHSHDLPTVRRKPDAPHADHDLAHPRSHVRGVVHGAGRGTQPVCARDERVRLRDGARRADTPRAAWPRGTDRCRTCVRDRQQRDQYPHAASPRCSCTAAGATSSATRCSSGCSATTSKTAWARGDFSPSTCSAASSRRRRTSSMMPASPVPTVGASGAISGVLGAYLVLYPRVRVNTLIFFFIVALPAWLVLIWWFGVQVLDGLHDAAPRRRVEWRRRVGAHRRIRQWNDPDQGFRESTTRHATQRHSRDSRPRWARLSAVRVEREAPPARRAHQRAR